MMLAFPYIFFINEIWRYYYATKKVYEDSVASAGVLPAGGHSSVLSVGYRYSRRRHSHGDRDGNDSLTIVNNLSNFVFSCIKAIGVIVLGWGVVQVGMSVQSHDASQRTQGFLCLFGGLLIAFAKEILALIGVV